MSATELYDKIIDSPILVYPPISPESDPVDSDDRAELFADLNMGLTRPRKGLLYFHIPFCTSRCAFCTYAAEGRQSGHAMIAEYLTPFFREIDSYANTKYAKDLDYGAVFIGGGSPSVLTEEQLELFLGKIRSSFDISNVTEYSMEFELRTMTEEKLRICREYGVTRISFGWQTFKPEIRKMMALAPTIDELKEKIGWLKKYGFSVNADLMFGMPEQTFEDWKTDVAMAIEFGITGLDIFKTENVPPAPMYEMSKKKNWKFVDSEEKRDMFLYAIKELEKAGYVQDCFQRMYHPDHPTSRLEYNKKRALASYDQLSMGTGAWGFIANRVYVNEFSTHDYLAKRDSGEPGSHLGCMYTLSDEEYTERSFVQGLSHNMVLQKDVITGKVSEEYLQIIEKLKQYNLMEENEQEYRLTKEANGYVFNIAHEFFSKKSKKKSFIFFMHQRNGRKGKRKTKASALSKLKIKPIDSIEVTNI